MNDILGILTICLQLLVVFCYLIQRYRNGERISLLGVIGLLFFALIPIAMTYCILIVLGVMGFAKLEGILLVKEK